MSAKVYSCRFRLCGSTRSPSTRMIRSNPVRRASSAMTLPTPQPATRRRVERMRSCRSALTYPLFLATRSGYPIVGIVLPFPMEELEEVGPVLAERLPHFVHVGEIRDHFVEILD